MDRLGKKCFIASVALHGTLAVVLVVGPAFLSSPRPLESKDIIDFIPSHIIEANMTGGGNPNVANPPPQPVVQPPPPPQPQTPPQPQPQPQPQPPPPQPRPQPQAQPQPQPRPDPQPQPQPTTRPIQLTPVVRNPSTRPQPDTRAQERAQAEAEARRRQETLNQSLARIRDNTGGKIEIGEVRGPGGGGPSYASFEAVLRSRYFNAWIAPTDATMPDAVVQATVTIASDGTVLSARITQPSGDPAVDRSVRRVLDEVTFIAPFPPGAKEKQRTYPLSFSLKAKRGLG